MCSEGLTVRMCVSVCVCVEGETSEVDGQEDFGCCYWGEAAKG